MAAEPVLLSFDIEEFDMPLEYGRTISLDEQIRISVRGTTIILDLLGEVGAKATFFSTVVFAERARDVIARLVSEGHELASHGYYHSEFEDAHLNTSRLALEQLANVSVTGFRMPRMKPVSDAGIQRAGYLYNSSLNPTFLPGRYNNLDKPRTLYSISDVRQLPASVTPVLRFPLFWLSFHNLPLGVYQRACARTIRKDGYLNVYFHPWEFTDLSDPRLGMPWYVHKNSGDAMVKRFAATLKWMKLRGYSFRTITSFLSSH